MKIEVTQEKLSKALNIVSRIANGRVTLPVLNNVLMRVDNKKVTLTTTNLDMAVVDYLPVSIGGNGAAAPTAPPQSDPTENTESTAPSSETEGTSEPSATVG